MAKEGSLTLRICDWVAKYSIYAAIFLIPIFFLPWTIDFLDFNKQALIILLGFVALFAWMIKTLICGKFELNITKIHIVVGALFLVYVLATIFSVNKYGSFWGLPQVTSQSLLTLLGFVVFYFLVSNIFSKHNIFTGMILISISALIAELIGFLQLFKLFIIPFNFAKSISFNTIGAVGSLGFFVAILLPLAMVMLIMSKKWQKILFAVQLILSALILLAINYPVVWWAVAAGSAFFMIFGILKRDLFDGRWMALPMFFLAVSIFFILLNPQILGISQKVDEISLSQKASSVISLKELKESPILGSGPGTFSYDFSKFKDPTFNQSALWNTIFNNASSKVLNDLASTGVLGLIALLAFMVMPVFYGIKFLISDKTLISDDKQKKYWILTLGIIAALMAQFVGYFLYGLNVVLGFLDFILIASLVGLIIVDKKQYELKSSSLLTLIVTFAFTLLFIFGLGLLVLDGQRYVAEINYYKGLVSWQSGNKVAGQKLIESAASLNPSSDMYFSQLSQVYLSMVQDKLKTITGAPLDTEKSELQTLIANSVNAAVQATNLNPKSSTNWANRGYIYQSLYGLMGGDFLTWAMNSYDQALKLDPNSSYLFAQEGIVNYISAQALSQDQAEQKTKTLNAAKEKLEKAIALNPNYANALYFLGLVYDAQGQKDKAIEEFTRVQQLNPQNATVQNILSNLNAGKPALQAELPPTETPPSTNK